VIRTMRAMTTTEIPTPTAAVQRVNPVRWAEPLGFDQGQLRTGFTSILTIAGQGPVDADGVLLHEGDVAAQLALTLANVAGVVAEAGMTMADVAMLRTYTTDIDATLAVWDTVTEHLGSLGVTPPAVLVQVGRLSRPGMVVEIDGLAIA
jgi:enamine deaminase RidA (YjgF/YER057c/UK114 family)